MELMNSILLVDDDSINNFINQRLFKNLALPFKISVALNGEEALEYLENNRENLPEFIFLDIEMPIMNGVTFVQEFFKIASSFSKEPKIIILKTTMHPEYQNILCQYPIQGYMDKPLTALKINEVLGITIDSDSR